MWFPLEKDQINSPNPKKPGIWQVIVSVLGAFFGVQSSKVRERDFMHGQPWWVYVLAGGIFCILLVILLVCLVKVVLMKKAS